MNDEVSSNSGVHRLLLLIVILGCLLRIAVFFTASPFNPDQHLEVIDFITTQHRLPGSLELGQAHHPPLYHLLMTPIWAATHSPKVLQFVSLGFSIANLLLIYRVLRETAVSPMTRAIALSFAAFMPQVVMYGSFISNDSLTMLLGTILFLRGMAYVREPILRNAIWLGVLCGLGLLTKGTFLLAPLALVLLPAFVRFSLSRVLVGEGRVRVLSQPASNFESRKNPHPSPLPAYRERGLIPHMAIILALCVLIGGYKYADNLARYHRPFVHNLDPDSDWKRSQQGKWPDSMARWNLNIIHLLREPILKVNHPASYPMLMYATLWYPHWPDSSYTASVNGYAWVGQILYVAGIVPTILLLAGVVGAIRSCLRREDILPTLAVAILLGNVALVIGVGAKFDVWSCFQSRLCFAAFTPGLYLFARALDASKMQKILQPLLCMAVAACLLYFLIEIPFACHLLPAGTPISPE